MAYVLGVRVSGKGIAVSTTTVPRRRQLVSLADAAKLLDVSVRTLRRRIADGTLPAYRVGRLLKVNPDDLERIVRPIPTVGSGAA